MGATIFNPHRYTLEEGGMKQTDAVQLAFKRETDPHGLLNPGKMIAWEDPNFDYRRQGISCFPASRQRARAARGGEAVRILVLFAHPVETSFVAALHARWSTTLRARGHEVDDCDLNAEGFDPVMSRQERIDYHDVDGQPRAASRPTSTACSPPRRWCFSFPVWNYGFPGDPQGLRRQGVPARRQLRPGDDGDYTPTLHNIRQARRGLHLWRRPLAHDSDGRSAAPLRHALDAGD